MAKQKADLHTKEILNTREAAALLKVTPQTIKNYIYSDKLPAIKTPGGHHRIRRIDLASLGFDLHESSGHASPTVEQLLQAYNDLLQTFTHTVESLIRALDSRDVVTAGHSGRVADLSCDIGRRLHLTDSDLQDLHLSALLHDVGKIGISETILGKPGRLTEQEFMQIKQHSAIGERIVANVGNMQGIASSIRHHHERYDGAGYPDAISGSDIELNSRIIAVAESYDFLRSDLSYRHALPPEASLQQITGGSGSQFDPVVVNAFVDVVKDRSLAVH